MDARERILAAIDHSAPVRTEEEPVRTVPAPEPEAILRMLASAEPAARIALTRDAELQKPARRGFPVLTVCLAAVIAGAAGFLLGGRWLPVATTPHAVVSGGITPTQTPRVPVVQPPDSKATPQDVGPNADAPFVDTVRSEPARQPAPQAQEVPERVFAPPPDRPAAVSGHVVLPEPALALPQVASPPVSAKLPQAVAVPQAPPPPVFKETAPVPAVVSGGKVQPPVLIHQVAPEYPLMARVSHTEGTVRLQATIGRDGAIQKLVTLSGPTVLVPAAERAVRRWVYRPALLDGRPVEAETNIEIDFGERDQ